MMEYLMYLFGDDTQLANLLASLSSAEEFENALSAYNQPIIKTSGGVFGFGEKRYTIECSFDLNLFSVLDRLQKLDLYEYIRELVHNNADQAKKIMQLLEKAVHLNTDPLALFRFFNRLKGEIERITRHTIYLFLHNIDTNHIAAVFDTLFIVLESLEQDVTDTLQRLRTSETKQHNKKGDDDDTPANPSACSRGTGNIHPPLHDNKNTGDINNDHDHAADRKAKSYSTRSSQRSKPYKMPHD